MAELEENVISAHFKTAHHMIYVSEEFSTRQNASVLSKLISSKR